MITYEEYMNIVFTIHNWLLYERKGKNWTEGDFITTSNYGDIFGGALARWFSNL